MTDTELTKMLRSSANRVVNYAADRIEVLTAERDEAINQLDSAIHSQIVLEKRTAAVMEDRRLILEERDRTFVLMLARAEKAEAKRDRLREALDGLLTSVEHADFEDGWCCCGDDMLHHQNPMDCGHTPVDMGEYHASLAIKEARAALKGDSHE